MKIKTGVCKRRQMIIIIIIIKVYNNKKVHKRNNFKSIKLVTITGLNNILVTKYLTKKQKKEKLKTFPSLRGLKQNLLISKSSHRNSRVK